MPSFRDLLFIEPDYDLSPALPPAAQHFTREVREDPESHLKEASNRAFLDRTEFPLWVEADPHPLPCPRDREYYFGDRHFEYWVSGLNDYITLRELAGEHGLPWPQAPSVLDFGGASGRVLRHFLCHQPQAKLYSSDLNRNNVRWMEQHFPSIRGFQTTIVPHLPLPDNAVDILTAYSVFTHIDLFEETWLMEIWRVARPGAVIALTVQSDFLWKRIHPAHFIYQQMAAAGTELQQHAELDALFAADMPSPRFVFRWGREQTHLVNVFHSHRYIRERWGRDFRILDIIVKGHLFQDLVLMQKPPR